MFPSDKTGLEKTQRLTVHYGLIVEDLPDARDWLIAAMGEAFPGIEIDTAASLADARSRLSSRLPQVALIDISLRAEGDLHIDDHHTVEDCGIAIGQALAKALGDKRGIRRYGECHLAMDDAQLRCALDLSGRPYLVWNVDFATAKIGTFDTELVREFFQALSTHGGITLHIDRIHGFNSHHIAEAAFKSVARALRMAVESDPRLSDVIPSTKGML